MDSVLPQNRRECIVKIREAFHSYPRPNYGALVPCDGPDESYVLKNWGNLTRDDIEALDSFGAYLAGDITYMSSSAFRYFVPSIMILFLTHPDRIDIRGFMALVSRFESVYRCRPDGLVDGDIALTKPESDAIRDWFGQLLTIYRKFKLSPVEDEYRQRIRLLRARAKIFTPDTDYDAPTPKATGRRLHDRTKAK